VSKGGDGAVVRTQSAHAAHRFEIAGAGLLNMARRPDLIYVPSYVESKHVSGVVAWSPRRRRDRTLKTQLGNIRGGNECIDDAYKRI
jgi:hypothetical protein